MQILGVCTGPRRCESFRSLFTFTMLSGTVPRCTEGKIDGFRGDGDTKVRQML